MTPELFWLVALSLLTASLWIPYILELVRANGLLRALSDGEHEVFDPDAAVRIEAKWAVRAHRAHANAVENLVAFAPIALTIHILRAGDETTAMLCASFFWLRVAHFIVYTIGLPYVRTFVFFTGYGLLMALGLRIIL